MIEKRNRTVNWLKSMQQAIISERGHIRRVTLRCWLLVIKLLRLESGDWRWCHNLWLRWLSVVNRSRWNLVVLLIDKASRSSSITRAKAVLSSKQRWWLLLLLSNFSWWDVTERCFWLVHDLGCLFPTVQLVSDTNYGLSLCWYV